MGVSSDGILLFGYCWDKGEDDGLYSIFKPMQEQISQADDPSSLLEKWSEENWTEVLLQRQGVINPWLAHPEVTDPKWTEYDWRERELQGRQWVRDNTPAVDAWVDAKQALVDQYGIELGTHCSFDHPMRYLAAYVITAHRGHPVPFSNVKDLYLDGKVSEWTRRLEKFIADLEVEKPEGQSSPTWWLCSVYG